MYIFVVYKNKIIMKEYFIYIELKKNKEERTDTDIVYAENKDQAFRKIREKYNTNGWYCTFLKAL